MSYTRATLPDEFKGEKFKPIRAGTRVKPEQDILVFIADKKLRRTIHVGTPWVSAGATRRYSGANAILQTVDITGKAVNEFTTISLNPARLGVEIGDWVTASELFVYN